MKHTRSLPKKFRTSNALPLVYLLLLCLGIPAWGAVRLYLKDGSYQMAREYKVEGDKVSYYSSERSEWEELPLNLIDLARTKSEVTEREDASREEKKVIQEEAKAEREARDEYKRVPQEFGAYWIHESAVTKLTVAESKLVNRKGRNVLKLLSPIPMITGKQTLELDGMQPHSIIPEPRPEFYIRLSAEERFGIVRLHERKGNRVVEVVTTVPVSNEVIEEPELVEIFRQQIEEGVYKIWPTKPLAPGDYAVVEYTEGKVNMQVWDLAYRPAPSTRP